MGGPGDVAKAHKKGVHCASYYLIRRIRVAVACAASERLFQEIYAQRIRLKRRPTVEDRFFGFIRRTRAVTPTRWQHPWLRVQRLIRAILEVRRDEVTRPLMKATLTKALREREQIRR